MLIKNHFEYFCPKTLKEALELISRYPENSKVIAGGQSLLILMKQGLITPRYLIDIKGIEELNYINQDQNKGLLIGALTSHRTIETSSLIHQNFRVLAEIEKRLASTETRNWGTIGGNLCHADPAGDICPILVAMGASVKLARLKGSRTLPIKDFSTGYFETAMDHDELLVEIQLHHRSYTGAAYEKFNLTKNDYATVSVAVAITRNNDANTCGDVKIILGAVAPTPLRAMRAEEILIGHEIKPILWEQAASIAAEEAEPVADMHASEEFKRNLVKALVKRVGQRAWERSLNNSM